MISNKIHFEGVDQLTGTSLYTLDPEQKVKAEEAVKYLNKFSADDQLVSPALLGTMGNCYGPYGFDNKQGEMASCGISATMV